MKRSSFVIFFISVSLFAFTLTVAAPASALKGELLPLQQSSLPQITFLGEGPQTFVIEPPLMFLVKTYQDGQFLFVAHNETSYEAVRHERVWTTNYVPSEPIRLFHESRSYGMVPEGCLVNYVQIEDNLDARRNTFYINGSVLQVVEQGMVTYGSFVVPEAGELTFYAEDSIGMVIEICPTARTVIPSETPEDTPTATETTSPTATVVPQFTDTAVSSTLTPTATGLAVTPTATGPAVTPTATVNPTITSTARQPSPTTTSTRRPITEPSKTPTSPPVIQPSATRSGFSILPTTPGVILVTATPVSTPAAIPVTGGGPGPREIGMVSAAILGLACVFAAAWWLLLRAYRDGR